MTETKRKGRPRKHEEPKERVRAWRRKQEGRRLDVYVSSSASWRLKRLAEVWGCPLREVVERLALEADDRYAVILFPETE